jgi:hypothetical protein
MPKLVDMKANFFGKHRETKVVVTKELHMKIQGMTTQTGLESQLN